jgi:hypothetical protein
MLAVGEGALVQHDGVILSPGGPAGVGEVAASSKQQVSGLHNEVDHPPSGGGCAGSNPAGGTVMIMYFPCSWGVSAILGATAF